MDETIARIFDDSYLDGLSSRPIEEVRGMRTEVQEIETGLSYLRRVLQGRLDIVGAEQSRRQAGGAPGDVGDLVDRLPEILGDHLRAPGTGRLPTSIGPGRLDPDLEARLVAIVAEFDLDHLDSADAVRLPEAASALTDLEQEVSARRRALFERIDALQAELTRRYRTGEANVESLLS